MRLGTAPAKVRARTAARCHAPSRRAGRDGEGWAPICHRALATRRGSRRGAPIGGRRVNPACPSASGCRSARVGRSYSPRGTSRRARCRLRRWATVAIPRNASCVASGGMLDGRAGPPMHSMRLASRRSSRPSSNAAVSRYARPARYDEGSARASPSSPCCRALRFAALHPLRRADPTAFCTAIPVASASSRLAPRADPRRYSRSKPSR